MSLTNGTTKETYAGDGANTTFPITFDVILNDTEIKVILRDETDPDAITEVLQTNGGDYTLTGASPPTIPFSTDVEMGVAPTATQKLLVYRDMPLTQLLDYLESSDFRSESQEKALDKLTAIAQELAESLTRAALLSRATAANLPVMFSEPAADNLIGWDAEGDDLRNYTAAEIVSLAIGQVLFAVNNLSDVDDAAISATNLGVGAASNVTHNTLTTVAEITSGGEIVFETFLDTATIATPANPAAGRYKLYVKADGLLYKLDSAGSEVQIGQVAFADDVFRIQDDGDATKEIAFQASGITTGTVRTITMPDTDIDLGDIAGHATTELDNLGTTALNADIVPALDAQRALGSNSRAYAREWVYELRKPGSNNIVIAVNDHILRHTGNNTAINFSNITGTVFSVPISMNTSNKIINLAEPTAAQDAATKNYVDTNIPAAGATTELDNLGTTAVNADILPDGDNTRDLGASGNRFALIHGTIIRADGGDFHLRSANGFQTYIRTQLQWNMLDGGFASVLRGADPQSGRLGIVTQNESGFDNTADLMFETGRQTGGVSGNSGSMPFKIGSSANGTQGEFSLLKEGVPAVVGDVLTASAVDGTFYWATPAAAAVGGGAGGLKWQELGSSPTASSEFFSENYLYQSGLSQNLYAQIEVPTAYVAGSPIAMRINWYSPDAAGTGLMRGESTLINGAFDSTTNQRTTTNAAVTLTVANDLNTATLDLTDGAGLINAVAVAAGDIIKVRVFRDTDTGASDLRFLPSIVGVSFE